MPYRRRRSRWVRRFTVFAPAGIVLISGLLSFAALQLGLASRQWVMHTRDVLDASTRVHTALLDAESSLRGFIITRDSSILEPATDAAARADQFLARLDQLTVDNPPQHRRVDSLAARARARLAFIDSMVGAARRPGFVVPVGASGLSGQMPRGIRRLIDGIQADEERLLRVRQRESTRAERIAAATIVLGTLLAGLLALFVNRNLDSALDERRLAMEELETANDRLREQAAELEAQADAAQAAAMEAQQAMEHAHVSLQAAEESERRAERLQAATEAFGGARSMDEVGNLILDQAIAALGAQSAALAALEENGTLRFVAVRNVSPVSPGSVLDVGDARPLCAAVRTGRPILLETVAAIREEYPGVEPDILADHVCAIASLPIRVDERVIGGITVRFTHARSLSPVDLSFMLALTRIAGEAFERARLFDAERAARAAAEAANRAKAAFLASMSHELRTPLQAALGFSQLVRSGLYGPVNEQQAEILGRVERSQTHLARLIDDILDFARLEAGRVRMELEHVPLRDVVVELAPLVEPQADKKRLELSLLPPPDSILVRADRHRLKQILVNLVGNAIKFTHDGGTIRLDAVADGDCAKIRVTDTGVGIPPDRMSAIFEPFVQVDDSHTRAHSGAGLGLAISRDLARAMGGELTAESTLGVGSTFTVALPISTTAAPV